MKINFIDLKSQYKKIKSSINSRIKKVLDHGQYILGPEVEELENKLSKYVGVKYCLTVSSGTEALLISLMALGVKSGDEVITTPFTYVATAEVIVRLGAKPVFVDVEIDTFNINADLIENKITKKTKAIMPVSLFGQIPDMDKINSIAKKYNIPVIEDGAQSFGATYKNKKSCSLSKIGCTSFFPSKPLGCYGDGGAIFTNSKIIYNICKMIRVHGQKKKYIHDIVGVGGRMDTLQCAIVLEKLKVFDNELKTRNFLAKKYNNFFNSLQDPNIMYPVIRKYNKSSYAQYTLILKNRAEIINRLKKMGMPSTVYYPVPLNKQKPYKFFCCPNCTPNSNKLSKKVLSLPMHPYLNESFFNIIKKAFKQN
jgi:UDP-2-acetamido-2-deoxy-ribo-hexuluronate aminotransferase